MRPGPAAPSRCAAARVAVPVRVLLLPASACGVSASPSASASRAVLCARLFMCRRAKGRWGQTSIFSLPNSSRRCASAPFAPPQPAPAGSRRPPSRDSDALPAPDPSPARIRPRPEIPRRPRDRDAPHARQSGLGSSGPGPYRTEPVRRLGLRARARGAGGPPAAVRMRLVMRGGPGWAGRAAGPARTARPAARAWFVRPGPGRAACSGLLRGKTTRMIRLTVTRKVSYWRCRGLWALCPCVRACAC